MALLSQRWEKRVRKKQSWKKQCFAFGVDGATCAPIRQHFSEKRTFQTEMERKKTLHNTTSDTKHRQARAKTKKQNCLGQVPEAVILQCARGCRWSRDCSVAPKVHCWLLRCCAASSPSRSSSRFDYFPPSPCFAMCVFLRSSLGISPSPGRCRVSMNRFAGK